MKEDKTAIRQILFATDFSVYSEKARNHARLLAKSLGASVTVLHAIELIHGLDANEPELKEWYRNLEKRLQAKLEKELDHFRKDGIEACGTLVFGTPWEVVISCAVEGKMDLIIIGSHGARTAEGGILLGTTSHKIALASDIPVLIVKVDQPRGKTR